MVDPFELVLPLAFEKGAVFEKQGDEIEDFRVFDDLLELVVEPIVVNGVEKGVDIALDYELMGLEQSFGPVDGFDGGFALLVGVAAVAKLQMCRELFIEDLLDDFGFGIRDGDDTGVAIFFGQRKGDMRSEAKKVILWRRKLELGSFKS